MQLVPVDDRDPEACLHRDVSNANLDNVENTVANLLGTNPVIMFSKSSCPFCFELKRTLSAMGIKYAVYEVDQAPNATEIKEHLKKISTIGTFPNLFVNKVSHGGCLDLKKLQHKGLLSTLFTDSARGKPVEGPRVSGMGLFWFPEAINRKGAQVSGCLGFLVCLMSVIFYESPATKWVVLALALDFFMRMLFGSSVSPIGAISGLAVSRLPLVLANGPSKQFAALCGTCMAGCAAVLLLAEQRIAGTIVVGMLMGPTLLEGAFDFCIGCVIFSYLIDFGIVSAEIYHPFVNTLEDKKWANEFVNANTPNSMPEAARVRVPMPGQKTESPADLMRKDRIETEYKFQDVHFVKHNRIDNFGLPLGLAGLALVFKFTTDGARVPVAGGRVVADWDTDLAFEVLGVASAVLFGLLSVLYALRCAFYPQKVTKEWNHPVGGNFFSMIPVCLVIYGFLLFDDSLDFGITLVWIGSVLQMALAVLRVASLVFDRMSSDLLNPSVMMAPIGCFVCALALATYQFHEANVNPDLNYLQIARLWFGVAAGFSVVLLSVTFNKALSDHHSDARLRPTLWLWLATTSLAGPALLAVSGYDPSVGRGVAYQSLFALSCFLFSVLAVGWVRGFFGYLQDMSIWIMSFSFSVLAFSALQYYSMVGDSVTEVAAVVAMVLAALATAVCFAHSLNFLSDGLMFRPKPKWGPISFMKLTHEALRFGLPNLVEHVKTLEAAGAVCSSAAVADLVETFDACMATYKAHGGHEDDILFPAVRRYFPGLNPGADEDHERQHAVLDTMVAAVGQWKANPSAEGAGATLLAALQKDLPAFSTDVLEHLRSEEATITVAARKHLPLDVQRELSNRVFNHNSAEEWAVIIPYTLRNLAMPPWKVQFLRTFIWANPARAQEIGLITYRGVDSVTWCQVSEAIPEMIPRGVAGHKRFY